MKRSMNIFSIVLALLFAFNAGGCSKFFGPSNEEALKAINDSGLLKSSGFTVTSPVTIVEKGKKQADGTWPVKVRMTVSFLSIKGGVPAQREMETTPTFLIYQAKDSAGHAVWSARLGG